MRAHGTPSSSTIPVVPEGMRPVASPNRAPVPTTRLTAARVASVSLCPGSSSVPSMSESTSA